MDNANTALNRVALKGRHKISAIERREGDIIISSHNEDSVIIVTICANKPAETNSVIVLSNSPAQILSLNQQHYDQQYSK